MAPNERRRGGYSFLFRDENVKRWYNNLAKGSPLVADNHLKALGRFCKKLNTTPSAYVKLPLRKMEDELSDFIDELESQTNPENGHQLYSPGYIAAYLKAIRSWAD